GLCRSGAPGRLRLRHQHPRPLRAHGPARAVAGARRSRLPLTGLALGVGLATMAPGAAPSERTSGAEPLVVLRNRTLANQAVAARIREFLLPSRHRSLTGASAPSPAHQRNCP